MMRSSNRQLIERMDFDLGRLALRVDRNARWV